jgi:hypothetical protein
MAETVVKTFDLYNTTFYWNGYSIPGFDTQLKVAKAYYIAQQSSNIIGSQIDFFNELAGLVDQNPSFNINSVSATITIDSLPYLWGKYWWDEAMYYTSSVVLSAISISKPLYYQTFSESVGSLYYISRFNNLQNTETVPFNTIIDSLLPAGISESTKDFYQVANSLFVANIANIGPGAGTDTAPANSNLIMADTDLNRRIASNTTLARVVNELYPALYRFLPFNTNVIGNLITPYSWAIMMPYEDTDTSISNTIIVDQTNSTIARTTQLPISALKV